MVLRFDIEAREGVRFGTERRPGRSQTSARPSDPHATSFSSRYFYMGRLPPQAALLPDWLLHRRRSALCLEHISKLGRGHIPAHNVDEPVFENSLGR